ncbi:MAG: transporter [Pirellulales bacterium]|nr:transporter [Pirellulales bacterium]
MFTKSYTLAGLRALAILAAVAVDLADRPLRAEAPTLLEWNYGDGGQGGPDRDEPLITDRPDFTEASSTVGRGVMQLEGGYTYAYDAAAAGSVETHSFPETLLRVGMLAEWFEFRMAWNYGQETDHRFGQSRTVSTGADDLYLGVKWGLTGQEGILPEMAFITQMTVPSGSSDFTAGQTLPGIVWLYGWDVNEWIATGAQTKANRALDDVTGRPYLEFSQSWTVNYSLADRLGAYTEWFVLAPDGADVNHTENYADGGFTFQVSNDLQLDLRGGVGLNEAAADYFIGSGFAIRR